MIKISQLDGGNGDFHPNRAGDLRVALFISESTEVFDEETKEFEVITLPQIVGAVVGETIYVGAIVDGYTLGKDGLMDFVIGIRLMGPDGQVVIDEREWSHLRDEAPIKPSFIMAKHRLSLDIEQGDPIGEIYDYRHCSRSCFRSGKQY